MVTVSSDAFIPSITGGETATTVNDLASLSLGTPLSVTRIVTMFVLGTCSMLGVHVNTPLIGLIFAPAGEPESKLKLSRLDGRSGSLAEFVMVSCNSTHATRLLIGASTGVLFTSLTTTVKLLVWLRAGSPSSVTLTVIVF